MPLECPEKSSKRMVRAKGGRGSPAASGGRRRDHRRMRRSLSPRRVRGRNGQGYICAQLDGRRRRCRSLPGWRVSRALYFAGRTLPRKPAGCRAASRLGEMRWSSGATGGGGLCSEAVPRRGPGCRSRCTPFAPSSRRASRALSTTSAAYSRFCGAPRLFSTARVRETSRTIVGAATDPKVRAFLTAIAGWLRWQLAGDDTMKHLFVGPTCDLCTQRTLWTVQQKNLD